MTTIEPIDTKFEAALLNAMLTRENYYKYIQHIDLKRCYPNTSLLLLDYKRYFETYVDSHIIDVGRLYTHFGQDWHTHDLEQHDIEYYRDFVFPAIESASDSEYALEAIIKRQVVEQIVKASTQGFDVSKIQQLIDTYREKHGIKSVSACSTVFDLDFKVLDKTEGIPWCLPSLQNSLMSITQGQLIVIAGDTNSGKSAFVKQQIAYTLKYFRKNSIIAPILHLNSEGTAADCACGVLSNIYRQHVPEGFEAIVRDSDSILQKFGDSFGELARQYHIGQMSSINTIEAVEQQLKRYKPSLCVIDITDTLAEEETAGMLKKVYDRLRILSAQYCPIICTSQAGNQEYYDKEDHEAKKRHWLTDKALYGSKQKGSAADAMIMIGVDEKDETIRYISTTKKKRGSNVRIVCRLHGHQCHFEEIH